VKSEIACQAFCGSGAFPLNWMFSSPGQAGQGCGPREVGFHCLRGFLGAQGQRLGVSSRGGRIGAHRFEGAGDSSLECLGRVVCGRKPGRGSTQLGCGWVLPRALPEVVDGRCGPKARWIAWPEGPGEKRLVGAAGYSRVGPYFFSGSSYSKLGGARVKGPSTRCGNVSVMGCYGIFGGVPVKPRRAVGAQAMRSGFCLANWAMAPSEGYCCDQWARGRRLRLAWRSKIYFWRFGGAAGSRLLLMNRFAKAGGVIPGFAGLIGASWGGWFVGRWGAPQAWWSWVERGRWR